MHIVGVIRTMKPGKAGVTPCQILFLELNKMFFHFITLATIVSMICQYRTKSVGAIMTSIPIITFSELSRKLLLYTTISHRHHNNNNTTDIAQQVILHNM